MGIRLVPAWPTEAIECHKRSRRRGHARPCAGRYLPIPRLRYTSGEEVGMAVSFRILGCWLMGGVLCALAQPPYWTSIEPAIADREIAINQGSAALWQSLKKLHTRASLIMVTAHPDDEDGGMLAYESRGRGTRAALLPPQRGAGGANVMSNDYFD